MLCVSASEVCVYVRKVCTWSVPVCVCARAFTYTCCAYVRVRAWDFKIFVVKGSSMCVKTERNWETRNSIRRCLSGTSFSNVPFIPKSLFKLMNTNDDLVVFWKRFSCISFLRHLFSFFLQLMDSGASEMCSCVDMIVGVSVDVIDVWVCRSPPTSITKNPNFPIREQKATNLTKLHQKKSSF